MFLNIQNMEENHSDQNRPKSRAVITAKKISLQCINLIVGTTFQSEVVTYPNVGTFEAQK